MNNEFLRHSLSTIEYRFKKSTSECKEEFGDFTLGKGSRTPVEIINHMFHVLKATRIFIEEERFENFKPEILNIESEIEIFLSELKLIDKTLSKKELGIGYAKRLLQGPFSDILTHIGQISMLQRLKGNPIMGEDFSASNIKTGLD